MILLEPSKNGSGVKSGEYDLVKSIPALACVLTCALSKVLKQGLEALEVKFCVSTKFGVRNNGPK